MLTKRIAASWKEWRITFLPRTHSFLAKIPFKASRAVFWQKAQEQKPLRLPCLLSLTLNKSFRSSGMHRGVTTPRRKPSPFLSLPCPVFFPRWWAFTRFHFAAKALVKTCRNVKLACRWQWCDILLEFSSKLYMLFLRFSLPCLTKISLGLNRGHSGMFWKVGCYMQPRSQCPLLPISAER